MLTDDTLTTLREAASAAQDKKAFALSALEVGDLTSYADAFLLCSAASERQVGAVVDAVRERLRADGRRPLQVEGESGSDWVLIDYGDVIVHVFTEARREYYALDALWGDAPRIDSEALGVDPDAGS
jgi:ribosome-associated protein